MTVSVSREARWSLRLGLIVLILSAMVTRTGVCQEPAASAEGVEDRQVTVRGTVTDANQRPVADASVYLAYATSGDTTMQSRVTSTDATGAWTTKVDPELSSDLVVLAFKPGHALGVAKAGVQRGPWRNQAMRLSGVVDVSMRLASPSSLTLRIVDEHGAPVAGARLWFSEWWLSPEVNQFNWNEAEWKDANRPAPPLLTAADGRVTIDHLAGHTVGMLVETTHHGWQGFRFNVAEATAAGETAVKLLPVCQLKLTLDAADKSVVNGRRIAVQRYPEPMPKPASESVDTSLRPWGGVAFLRADAEGQASGVVPAGTLYISVARKPADRVFPTTPSPVQAEAGRAIEHTIHYEPGIKLTGRARTNDDQPVANVGVSILGQTAKTGSDGVYTLWVPASQAVSGQVHSVPEGFAYPFEQSIYASRPENAQDAFEIPDFILRKSTPVSGQVVNETGQPVAGASVVGSWVQRSESGGFYTLKSNSATSDEFGKFRLQHVYPDVDVHVTAQTDDRSVLEASSFHSGKSQELKLTVTPDGMVSVAGKVAGTEGEEVSHAIIKIARAKIAPGGHNYGMERLAWNNGYDLPADANGSFLSPIKVPRWGKYSLTVSAPRYLPRETLFETPASTGSKWDVGMIRLTKTRFITGTVHDSAGAPVSGAEVWSWAAATKELRSGTTRTTAKTDAEGHFTLENVHPLAALAFVTKEGFQLTGCGLYVDQPNAALKLFRTDESIPADRAVKPAPADGERNKQAVESLIQTLLPKQRGSSYFHEQLLLWLVLTDPARAREELPKVKSANDRAITLARLGEIEDALAEAEGIENAYSRAYCRFALVDIFPNADLKRELLAAALLDAQAIAEPDRRSVVIARSVQEYSGIGDHELAATILRDERSRAQALSTKEWSGFARGYFAAQLARIDPEAALRMASEATAEDQIRHYQNIAHVLAATHPEAAEKALGAIKKHRYINEPAVRVAYRMAPVDLPRALRLLEQIDTRQREVEISRGLGVVAWAIRESDPPEAKRLLKRAFDRLPSQTGASRSGSADIFGTALELVRYAEDIDPERLTEYFWWAAGTHPGPTGAGWSPDDAPRQDAERQAQLALLVCQYDATPKLAEQIMQPVFEYWDTQIGVEKSSRFTDHEGSYMAMALTHPARAVEWSVRFYDKLDPNRRSYIPQPWEVVGNALTKDRRALGEYITREVFHRWVIDQFDL